MPDTSSKSVWDRPWRERPSEQAALLNPAFVGELLARGVDRYVSAARRPLPLPLTFLMVPLVLAPKLRGVLPRRANATFGTWIATNAPALVDLPDRMLGLRPVTREALLFLAQIGALGITAGGIVHGPHPLRLGTPPRGTAETADMRRAAELVGRWFGGQADPVAILQGLGTKP